MVPRKGSQAGFSFVEVLVGIVILAIVAGGLAQGLAMSSRLLGSSRVDSVAHEIASAQLDQSHRMGYDELGIVSGNPPGIIPAVQTKTVQGIQFRITTDVRYVDDQAMGQPRNYVNYKKVMVTVDPLVSSGRTVTQTTVVAPPAIGAVAGKAAAFVTVVDSMTSEPLQGATVTINGSTSADRSDITDVEGRVVFAGLDPSPEDVNSPLYYYHLTTSLGGYVTHRDSVPAVAKQHLAATQTWTTTLKMFKPATVQVNLWDVSTGTRRRITEYSEVSLTSPQPTSETERASGRTGGYTFTQIAGSPIEPSLSPYQLDVAADCYRAETRQSALPAGYPTVTTHVFDIDMQPTPRSDLDVTVVDDSTLAPIAGAQVQVSGGQAQIAPTVRTADAQGKVHFCLPPSGSVNYVVSAIASGYGAGSWLAATTQGQTTGLTMRLRRTNNTCKVTLTARSSNRLVRLAARGTTSYDQSQFTNSSNKAEFPNLATVQYDAYLASGFANDGSPLWTMKTTPANPIRCNAGQSITFAVE